MNGKLIKKLVDEATSKIPDEGVTMEEEMTIFIKEYTKLVVDECVMVSDWAAHYTASYNIKKHFEMDEVK
jgi:hypothetical protein